MNTIATLLLWIWLGASANFVVVVNAWILMPTKTTCAVALGVSKDSWSVIDDWSSLSSQHPENATPDSATLFNQDLATNAARDIEAMNAAAKLSEEDIWINDVVDEIHNAFSTLEDANLYDTEFEESSASANVHSLDDMGNEIAMLVRCNEQPQELLISQGRALPPLSDEEKNNVNQLVVLTQDECEATSFLRIAVHKIFHKHAKPSKHDGVLSMGRPEVASWMTRALQEKYATSSHDSRVLKTISDYGKYGSGRLEEEDLHNLYLSVVVGDISKVQSGRVSPERHLQLRHPFVQSVFRDIRNHNMISPVESQRQRLAEQIEATKIQQGINPLGQVVHTDEMVLDECEILDWDYRAEDIEETAKRQASGERSSHKSVELVPKTGTPLMMRDGEFVFIDEESCIGCMQCANVAPNSFLMLDSGRARTFKQRKSLDVQEAVASCPVNCMHAVSYKELEEFETARDNGDGRTDHKHLGHRRGHTPLYVAGIDSDNNHRTSWYHTLKQKCRVSSDCPQKGCYQCPTWGKPGNNPYFKARHLQDEHIRAQHFLERGDLDFKRNEADL